MEALCYWRINIVEFGWFISLLCHTFWILDFKSFYSNKLMFWLGNEWFTMAIALHFYHSWQWGAVCGSKAAGHWNGSKALSFGGGNGVSRAVAGSSHIGGGLCTSTGLGGSQGATNCDGKGTYIVFNAADTLFINDLNSQEKVFSHFTGCKLRTVFVKVQSFSWHYLGLILFSFFILGCCFFLVSLFLQAIVLETISVYFLPMLILCLWCW